ncbi:MAG: ABC transporter substrate-binding protein [Candidatus Taylorbacteria bacterium]|nr:ABC transporter substrate-binding protein [Candidatus Taylorbacteria bacterium]
MKKVIIIVLICAAIVAIIINVQPKNNDTIKIGAVISLTGFAAPWGEYSKNGMELAVKNINANGGINGRQIELVIEDDHTEGKDAVTAYNKLVSLDNVDGVIGGTFDFTAQPLIPLALNNKRAFISPANFRIEEGFDLNAQSFVMRTNFNQPLGELRRYLEKEKINNLAVVHLQSSFGKEIAKTLDSVMKSLGYAGIVNEEYTQIGNNDFKTTIAKLKSQKVDAVFLDMVGNDPVNFLVQSKQLGFTPKIISYNGLTDSFVDEKDKSILEGVAIINWEVSSPEFTKLYKAEYNAEPAKSADKSFEAVHVLADAIAKTTDASQVASYIAQNSFETPNGVIKFNPDHTTQSNLVEIQVIRNGVQVKY